MTEATNDYAETVGAGDQIDSIDEANQAALQEDLALRIQPPAPGATRYIYSNGNGWELQKHGQTSSKTISPETARNAVEWAIERNERTGGGITAVSKSNVEGSA